MNDPRQPVFVPVRPGACGSVSIRLFRRPDGVRAGVAFTSEERLDRVIGGSEPRIVIGLSALRSTLAQIGVAGVQVDPEMCLRSVPSERSVS